MSKLDKDAAAVTGGGGVFGVAKTIPAFAFLILMGETSNRLQSREYDLIYGFNRH